MAQLPDTTTPAGPITQKQTSQIINEKRWPPFGTIKYHFINLEPIIQFSDFCLVLINQKEKGNLRKKFRAPSFTSLRADIHHDMYRFFFHLAWNISLKEFTIHKMTLCLTQKSPETWWYLHNSISFSKFESGFSF